MPKPARSITIKSSAAADEFLQLSEDDNEGEDDVQAILAVLQARKEKQQKLKKQIRERALKSHKELKGESEASDRVCDEFKRKLGQKVEEMRHLRQELDEQAELVGIAPESEEALRQARSKVHEQASALLTKLSEVERFAKRHFSKMRGILHTEAKRARSEEETGILQHLQETLQNCIHDLSQPTGRH